MTHYIRQYVIVEQGGDNFHFSVHRDTQLFLCDFDADHNPIWSPNLQDTAIWCRESAELLADQFSADFSPISVDIHVAA